MRCEGATADGERVASAAGSADAADFKGWCCWAPCWSCSPRRRGPRVGPRGPPGPDPADGTVLKSAPRYITLTFTESVGLLDDSFRVLDPDNKRVAPARRGTRRAVRTPPG